MQSQQEPGAGWLTGKVRKAQGHKVGTNDAPPAWLLSPGHVLSMRYGNKPCGQAERGPGRCNGSCHPHTSTMLPGDRDVEVASFLKDCAKPAAGETTGAVPHNRLHSIPPNQHCKHLGTRCKHKRLALILKWPARPVLTTATCSPDKANPGPCRPGGVDDAVSGGRAEPYSGAVGEDL